MAVQARNNLLAQQRLDLTHILAAESFTAFDFRTLMTMFTGSAATYIMRGFHVTGKSGLTVSVNLSDAMVVNPQDNSGSFYRGLPSDPDQIVQLPANQTNVFVEATFQIQTMAPVSAAFWNPLSLTGEDVAGDEFSASTDSQVVIVFTITSNTTGFSPGAIPLYKISTDSSSVTAIEDARNLMFRLGKGGVTPNPSYRFPWSVNRQDSVLSGPGVDEDANSSFLRQDGTGILNDKGIYDMKSWMDAVMTRFIEITGSSLWFSSGAASVPVTGLTLSTFFFDSDNGSYINPAAKNTLLWFKDQASGDLSLRSNGQGISSGRGTVEWQSNYSGVKWELGGTFVNNVPGGTRTYLVPTFTSGVPVDGGNIYLFLEREVPKGSGNAVQWANVSADPTNLTNPNRDVSGQAGDFTGIAIGDFIRKDSEGYSRYSKITKMVDGLGGIFTTLGYVADNTITGVELADVIISGPSSERLIYFRSRYSNADIYVDTVVDTFNFRDLDYYWIGRRVGQNFILKNHGTLQPGEEFKIEDSDSVNGTGGSSGGQDLTVQHAGLAAFSAAGGLALTTGSGTITTIRRRKRDNTIPSPGPLNSANSNSYLTYTIASGLIPTLAVGDGLWARLSDTAGGALTLGNVTDPTDAQDQTSTVNNVVQVLSAANSPLRNWDNRDVYLIARCIATNVLQFLDGTQLSLLGRYNETQTEYAQNVQFDGSLKLNNLTAGSVLFLDSTKTIAEDNPNFTYDAGTGIFRVQNYLFGNNTLEQVTPGDMNWFLSFGSHTLTAGSPGSTFHWRGGLVVDGGVTAIVTQVLVSDDKTLTLGVGNANNGGAGSGIDIADNTQTALSYASTSGQPYINVTYAAPHGYVLTDVLYAETNEPVGGIVASAMNRGYTVVTTGSIAGDAQIISPTVIRLWTNASATSTQTITVTYPDPSFRTYQTPSWIYMTDSAGGFTGMSSWGFTVKGKETTTITPLDGYNVVPTANTSTKPMQNGRIAFASPDTSGPGGTSTGLDFSADLTWDDTAKVLTVGGGLAVTGDFLPSADNLYNLGSQTLRWKTLNVGPGSLHVWHAPTNTTSSKVLSLQFTGTLAQLEVDAATILQLHVGTTEGIRFDILGNIGIGGLPDSSSAVYIQQAGTTTGTNQYGVQLGTILNPSSQSVGLSVAILQDTVALTQAYGIQVSDISALGGATVANQVAIAITELTSATINIGLQSGVTAGANKWGFQFDTAQSYHKGFLGLGTVTVPTEQLHLQGTAAGTSIAALVQNTAASFTGEVRYRLATATKAYTMGVGGVAHATAALQDAWFLRDLTAAVTRIIVASNGNVGIGIGATVPGALLNLGTNTTVAAGGMLFGTDTNLYRVAANGLKTDGNLTVGTALAIGTTLSGSTILQIGTNTTTAVGGAIFGTDTTLYRSAAATLTTDGSLIVGANLTISTMTPGSILFATTAGLIAQDNATFFWDTTNKRLGIQTNVTTAAINIGTTGSTTAAQGILFGTDSNLYRTAVGSLKTDTAFSVGTNLTVSGLTGLGAAPSAYVVQVGTNTTANTGGVLWGTGLSNIYRSAADTLKTDGSFIVAGSLTVGSTTIGGALNLNYGTTKTSTYVVLITDGVVPYDTTSGGFTITLPASTAGNKGQVVILKDVGGQVNVVGKAMTLAPNATDTIDGVNANVIVNFAPRTSLILISNGAGGWIIT